MSFDANLLSDNVEGAAEMSLPELVTDYGYFMRCAAAQIYIVRGEESSENGVSAQCQVVAARNAEHVSLRQGAIRFDIDGRAAPADQTGENALAAFQLLKDWEG